MIRAALASALVLAVAACAGQAPERDEPERVALALFDLAHGAEPDAARLDELFDLAGDERRRAGLYDALALLPAAGRQEVRRVERLEDLGRVVVEVRCGLDGNAEALYTVQLEPGRAGRLGVTGFDGPGVSWPPRARSGGTGLTSRPEP